MKIVFNKFIACLVVGIVCIGYAHGLLVGPVLQNAHVYPLSNTPIDPHLIEMDIAGKGRDGSLLIRISDPSTVVLPSGVDGNDFQDVTFNLLSTNNMVRLGSYFNTISNYSKGTAMEVSASGSWIANDFNVMISYVVKSVRPTTTVYRRITLLLAGTIVNHVYKGPVYVLNLVDATGNTDPDQIFVMHAVIDSSDVEQCIVPGYVATSPYGTPMIPTARPAPYYCNGSIRDATLSTAFVLNGNIDLVSSNFAVSIVNGTLSAAHTPIQSGAGQALVSGIVTSATGARYFIDDSRVLLSDA